MINSFLPLTAFASTGATPPAVDLTQFMRPIAPQVPTPSTDWIRRLGPQDMRGGGLTNFGPLNSAPQFQPQPQAPKMPNWTNGSFGGNIAGYTGYAAPTVNPEVLNYLRQAMEQYQANLMDARQRALADRAQAMQYAGLLQGTVNGPDAQAARQLVGRLSTNPFGQQFQEQSLQRQQEERARQLAAAEAQLTQQYAASGRTVDPRALAMLRTEMARQGNADQRNIQIDTAEKRFSADTTAAQAAMNWANQYNAMQQRSSDLVYQILSNTEYLPGTQDLSILMQLGQLAALAPSGGTATAGSTAAKPNAWATLTNYLKSTGGRII